MSDKAFEVVNGLIVKAGSPGASGGYANKNTIDAQYGQALTLRTSNNLIVRDYDDNQLALLNQSGSLTLEGTLRFNSLSSPNIRNDTNDIILSWASGVNPTVTMPGDLAVNGGDISSTSANVNIFSNNNARTVVFGGDLTTLVLSNYIYAQDTQSDGTQIVRPLTISRIPTTTGVANQYGIGLGFRAKMPSGSDKDPLFIDALSTDLTSGSEDFQLNIRLLQAGLTPTSANSQLQLDSIGNLTITGDIKIGGNDIQCSSGASTITMTSANTATTIRGDTINLQTAASAAQTSAGISYTRTYGEFAYTAGTITIAAQNTIYAFPLDTTFSNSGVTISNTSRVNINVSGTYKIIMSLQAAMETNSIGQFDFWLRKNGNDVANSATQVDLLKDQKAVIAMDWLVSSNGTDYFEIVYASSDADYADIDFPYIAAWTTPGDPYNRPAAPPIIVNVIPAGM